MPGTRRCSKSLTGVTYPSPTRRRSISRLGATPHSEPPGLFRHPAKPTMDLNRTHPFYQERAMTIRKYGGKHQPEGTTTYPFPVRPGVIALLDLPDDLTANEAARLAEFVTSLA